MSSKANNVDTADDTSSLPPPYAPPSEIATDENEKKTKFETWFESIGGKSTKQQQLEFLDKMLGQERGNTKEDGETWISCHFSRKGDEKHGCSIDDSVVDWSRGISVHWLKAEFFSRPEIQAMVEYGCPLWFLRDVFVKDFLVRQGFRGCSLIQWVAERQEEEYTSVPALRDVKPMIVSVPDRFLSYTGQTRVSSLIDMLAGLSNNLHVWFDVFNVNQFAWQEDSDEMKKFKDVGFSLQLEKAIESIASTILCVDEWDVCIALRKIWVVWEMYLTAKSESNLELISTETEGKRLRSDIVENGIDAVEDSVSRVLGGAFWNIDIGKATAYKEEDRRRILQHIENGSSFANVNLLVAEKLRNWCKRQLGIGVNDSVHHTIINRAIRLHAEDRHRDAEILLSRVPEDLQEGSKTDRMDWINSCHCRGMAACSLGDFGKGLPLVRRSLRDLLILREVDASKPIEDEGVAVMMGNLGLMLMKADEAKRSTKNDTIPGGNSDEEQGDKTQSKDSASSAISTLSSSLSEAIRLLSIGWSVVRRTRGDLADLTKSFESPLFIAMLRQKEFDQALALGKHAYETRKRILGAEHAETIVSRNLLVGAYVMRENPVQLPGMQNILWGNTAATPRPIVDFIQSNIGGPEAPPQQAKKGRR